MKIGLGIYLQRLSALLDICTRKNEECLIELLTECSRQGAKASPLACSNGSKFTGENKTLHNGSLPNFRNSDCWLTAGRSGLSRRTTDAADQILFLSMEQSTSRHSSLGNIPERQHNPVLKDSWFIEIFGLLQLTF